MATVTVHCPCCHCPCCDSDEIYRHGLSPAQRERFHCQSCRRVLNVAPFQGERHGFAVPMLCMVGAPLYTQLHVYTAPGKAAVHRR